MSSEAPVETVPQDDGIVIQQIVIQVKQMADGAIEPAMDFTDYSQDGDLLNPVEGLGLLELAKDELKDRWAARLGE